jgi:hypothetical protein
MAYKIPQTHYILKIPFKSQGIVRRGWKGGAV